MKRQPHLHRLPCMLALCLATFSGVAAKLSDIEKRWLRGVWPVVQ